MQPRWTSKPPFDVIAIAASAGGVSATMKLLGDLPAALPVPIIIAQHLGDSPSSILPEILANASEMPVGWARDGDGMASGRAYVAPAGAHLRVGANGRFQVTPGPRYEFVLPSANLLFESLAETFGPRVLGVVLTGFGSDSAKGITQIKAAGGRVIAQDRASSSCFQMPHAAIATGCVDFVLPLDKIAPALVALTMAVGAADLLRVGNPSPTRGGRFLHI